MKIDVYRWIELELNATIQTLNDDIEEADKKRNKILKDVFTGAESRIMLKQFVFWNNKYINYKRQREHLEDSLVHSKTLKTSGTTGLPTMPTR